jgi:hypothetical protein
MDNFLYYSLWLCFIFRHDCRLIVSAAQVNEQFTGVRLEFSNQLAHNRHNPNNNGLGGVWLGVEIAGHILGLHSVQYDLCRISGLVLLHQVEKDQSPISEHEYDSH